MAIQHISLFILLLAAAVAPGLATSSVVIASTCAAAANSTWHTSYDFCMGTLSADPMAASATDARGVAIAAANLTAANVTSTVCVLTDLIDSLQQCLHLYKAMSGSVTGGINDLQGSHVDAALLALKDASWQPAMCELALMEGNSTPRDPVSDENNASTWLSAMASDITEALHDHRTTPPKLKN